MTDRKKILAAPARKSLLAKLSLLHVALVAIALTMIVPFVWMVLTSLKTSDEVGSENWLPHKAQWSNYKDVFDTPTIERPLAPGIPFARYYWNSIFIASWVTFLQVITSALAAYSFARIRWRGRDKIFLAYLATMMLPGLVMMIPNYQIMIQLRLIDTFTGLILPAAFSTYGTFLLRQFMLTIPTSLDEAAEIDGAGHWRTFLDIILPLSRPGLITLTIFTFLGNYQSFFWPLVMLKNQAKLTLPIGMMYFENSRYSATHLLMAAVTMSVLPLIVLFVVLQKYLVRGIQLGAVKG